MVNCPRMTRIGLYSEDRSLHPLLSSALGKDFEVLLQSDEDETDVLASTANCDVMILALYSSQGRLQARLEYTRRLIASNVPAILMADDSLRSTAFELVRSGAFGYCRRPPSVRDLKTMLSRACETSALKQQLYSVQHRVEEPGKCDRIIG